MAGKLLAKKFPYHPSQMVTSLLCTDAVGMGTADARVPWVGRGRTTHRTRGSEASIPSLGATHKKNWGRNPRAECAREHLLSPKSANATASAGVDGRNSTNPEHPMGGQSPPLIYGARGARDHSRGTSHQGHTSLGAFQGSWGD